MKSVCLKALLVAVLAVAGTATAQVKAPSTLDIRQAISELSIAAQQADRADTPLDNLAKLKKWDDLLVSCKAISTTLRAAVAHTDSVITAFKEKAEKYQAEPSKADVFKKRIEGLQQQSDTLALLGGQLDKSAASLKSRLDRIKTDPDVKAALETQNIMNKVDAALQVSSNAVPSFLKD